MRRLTAALAALVTAMGLALVVAAPANADITAPGNGAVLRGTATLSASGGYDNSGLQHCGWFGGSGGSTRFRLINSSNTIVFEQFWDTGGSRSTTINTHSYPNGNYTFRDIEEVRQNSGFLGLGCKTDTNTYNRSVSIDNFLDVSYSGATTAPRNTSIPVQATVTDGDSGDPVSGITVSFALTGGGSVSANTNGSGVANASLPVQGSPRSATLTITANGTSYWRGGSINRSFEVTKNDTTTTLAQPATVVHGQQISFTASVAADNGTGTPTGTIQFKVDGSDFGAPVALSGGSASTPPTNSLSTGSHAVQAVYSGDSGFLGSTSATKTAQINKADTTVVLNSAPNPSKYGQSVTFTAVVGVVAPGVGYPTGGVQFNIDGQPFGTAVPLSGNIVNLTVSNLDAGNHQVEAVYNGDADFNSSSSAEITQGVDMADTDLSLTTSDPNPVSGQALTYTAQVTAVAPGAGVPPGQVQFSIDGSPLGGPVTLNGSGQAVSPVTHLGVGAHNVTANYLGTSNYGGSNDSYTQQVAAAQTSTTLTSSPNPSVFGQEVTLHAEVSPVAPATGTPSGAIRFTVDGTTLAIIDLTGNSADYAVSNLAVGAHSVKATYLSDDPNFITSSSPTGSQVVNKAATTTTVSSDSPTSVYGQPVTFTATVSVDAPGAGSPSGDIVFSDGSTVLTTVPVSSATGFQATYTTGGLSVGQHAITATYSGDDSFQPSNDSATQTVQKASTSTVVTSSNNPALSGQSTVFTAEVAPVAPGAGDPSGTVLFTVNGLPLGGQRPLVNGVATSPAFTSLVPGTYKVQAQYSGDGNFLKSNGLLDQGAGQAVSKGSTSMTLSASPSTVNYNAPVTFSTTVSAVAPATGKPSGVVRFWENDELLGSVSLTPGSGNSSSAEFVSSTLGQGAHGVRAEYVGNFNFNGAEATTSVTVNRAPTTTGVSSSANPSTFGDDVTLTATVSKALPAAGQPTGTVTFKEGSAVLGSATLSTVGGQQVASITASGLSGGAHAITATYSGDGAFSGSTSAAYTQNVSRQATTIVAGSPVPGSQLGTHAGYVRARLTDASGNPMAGRTVSFTNKPFGSRPAYHLCDGVTNAQGLAECDYTVINIDPSTSGDDLLIDVNGDYDATFAGDQNYLPATARGHLF